MKVYKTEDYIKDGLCVGMFKNTERGSFGQHTHEFSEIIFVLDGEVIEEVNGTSYQMRRGDMLFINYASTHAFRARDEFTYVNVCFSPEIMARRFIHAANAFDLLSLTAFEEIAAGKGEGVIHFFGDECRLLEQIFLDMENEFRQNLPDRITVIESYMNVVLSKILRKLHPVQEERAHKDRLWNELLDYIHENIDKRLTLDDLAKKCFYNPSYFSRIFKERFGMTLADYLAKERTDAAARLLLQTDQTTERIAELCGYADKSGLYRAFAKQYGMNPTQYRQENSKK